jgi:hypothetical protein
VSISPCRSVLSRSAWRKSNLQPAVSVCYYQVHMGPHYSIQTMRINISATTKPTILVNNKKENPDCSYKGSPQPLVSAVRPPNFLINIVSTRRWPRQQRRHSCSAELVPPWNRIRSDRLKVSANSPSTISKVVVRYALNAGFARLRHSGRFRTHPPFQSFKVEARYRYLGLGACLEANVIGRGIQ